MPKRKPIPETSREAYQSLVPEQLTDTYRKILEAIGALGECTSQESAAYLKVDHAIIWKRYNELVKMNLIYNTGNKRKNKSGRRAFTYRLVNPPKTENEGHPKFTQAQENYWKDSSIPETMRTTLCSSQQQDLFQQP